MTMPMNLHPQYITDDKGNKLSVVLSINEFDNILVNEQNTRSYSNTLNIFHDLQIDSMSSTWNNDKDKAWDEL